MKLYIFIKNSVRLYLKAGYASVSFLIYAIKNGNNEALQKISRQYRNDFIRWARSNYHVSNEEAKDVFQEVVLA
ncbi:hypothetical protein [Pedobacter sp.]|uniref:hypothetical protein n=1 Tax=Pedobacter sp. TaxID=1411316 RepID=UPI003D7F228C